MCQQVVQIVVMRTRHYSQKNLYEEFGSDIPRDLGKMLVYARSSIHGRRILEEKPRKFRMCLVKHIVVVKVTSLKTKNPI